MSTIELKARLKERIEELNQVDLLEQLLGIIEFETSEEVMVISKSHLKSVNTGLDQVKNGGSFTNDEVLRRIDEWADK